MFDPREDGHSAREKEVSDSDGESSATTSRQLVPHRENSMAYRNREDLLREKDRVWESLANKTLPPEESALIMRRLEKKADAHTRRTYIQGNPTSQVIDSAVTVSVGLTFLPGADKAQVTKIEQRALNSSPPDQKSATWRVNTAAGLLKGLDIAPDLSLKEHDRTWAIASAAKARWENNASKRDSVTASMQQLAVKDKDAAVTIDSKHVKIVNDLRDGQWDMEATLIEVDGVSLLGLMINYRYLISRTGPNMTFEENRNLLDIMIEDARRLCVRSPVLFRMSTRARIINSKNTRYGIDQYDQFRTISTSQGIKEIISISASYFDALDPEGSNDMNQRYIKPRFLQMLTLLLLFLNNEDLKDIKPILEATYRIKADRAHIEMLILKVIPLTSINSTVFMEALVPAVEGYNLQHPATAQRQPEYWDTFVQNISSQGYIIPGSVESLGRPQNSWIVKWPEEGFKSTEIFKHLQYSGDSLRTINEITRVNLHPEDSFKELTVSLLDGSEYILGSSDIERITTMSTGEYTVIEARGECRKLELKIQEVHLSAHLEQAIAKVNSIIDEVNRLLAAPNRRRLRLRGSRSRVLTFMNNHEASGRMTKHIAWLNGSMLTTAYKIEARKITKKDAWRKMAYIDRSLDVVLRDLERWAAEYEDPRHPGQLIVALQDARHTLMLAQDARRTEANEADHSDEPIASVMYPIAEALGLHGLWHDYHAAYLSRERAFRIHAKVAPVTHVSWIKQDVVEVQLEGQTAKYFATPLEAVDHYFEPQDEVQVGDHAALVGRYLVLAERSDDQSHPTFLMTNYLRITGVEETVRGRRGANRAKTANPMQPIIFL